jgi:hypothetical protein
LNPEACECDVWDRWICFRCACKEGDAEAEYCREFTVLTCDPWDSDQETEYDSDTGEVRKKEPEPQTMDIGIHQNGLMVCSIGDFTFPMDYMSADVCR